MADSNDVRSAISRTGYAIKVANGPTCWVSKMKTEVALSTTEAEHIALSQSTRDLIPIRNMVEYLNQFIKVNNKEITTYSTLFEDNTGTLQLATEPNHRPRTKNMSVKYHHFRHYIKKKIISIQAINTNDQQADVLIKPLALDEFRKFRQFVSGCQKQF